MAAPTCRHSAAQLYQDPQTKKFYYSCATCASETNLYLKHKDALKALQNIKAPRIELRGGYRGTHRPANPPDYSARHFILGDEHMAGLRRWSDEVGAKTRTEAVRDLFGRIKRASKATFKQVYELLS